MQLPKKEFNCMCCCAKTQNKIAVKNKDVWTPKTYPPVKFLLNAQSVNIGNSIHSRQVPSHSPTKKHHRKFDVDVEHSNTKNKQKSITLLRVIPTMTCWVEAVR